MIDSIICPAVLADVALASAAVGRRRVQSLVAQVLARVTAVRAVDGRHELVQTEHEHRRRADGRRARFVTFLILLNAEV